MINNGYMILKKIKINNDVIDYRKLLIMSKNPF